MMKLDEAIQMAAMMSQAFAVTTGLDCLCLLGPCHEGVRWEVVTRTGARLAVGIVAVCVEATEDECADAAAPSPARLALAN